MSDNKFKYVSTKELDVLDQDPPLRGQNFVCLSFISPEDVIKKKDVFFFENFLQYFSNDMSEFMSKLEELYPDDIDKIKGIKERYNFIFNTKTLTDEYNFFVSNNSEKLESEYYEKNNFQTTIRGLKVRGVFESLKEAEIRSQVLRKIDEKFNVYVAEVGCWCPWSPNPEDIKDQQWAETQLNTLMKEYKDNQTKKDEFFEQRKRELQFANVKQSIEKDNWLDSKENQVTITEVVEPSSEPVSQELNEEVHTQESSQPITTNVSAISINESTQEPQHTEEVVNISNFIQESTI